MWRGTTSLPTGQARCRDCRRRDREAREDQNEPETRTCRNQRCRRTFQTTRPTQIYCTPKCRPGGSKDSSSTTRRGYGSDHQAKREEWRPYVEAGTVDCHAVVCYMTTRAIIPGTPWDLGHTEDRTAWTGPEHRYCNRKEPQLRAHQPRTPRRLTL